MSIVDEDQDEDEDDDQDQDDEEPRKREKERKDFFFRVFSRQLGGDSASFHCLVKMLFHPHTHTHTQRQT
jgi:hypothetical protein